MARGNRTKAAKAPTRAPQTAAAAVVAPSASVPPVAPPVIPPPTPPVEAALHRARQQALDHVSRYEQVLNGESNEMPYPRPSRAGGVTGDVRDSALDLVQLALWAQAAGDTAMADRLMERARAHQAAHLESFGDQDDWASTNHRSYQQSAPPGAERAKARWLQEEIDRLMDPAARRAVAARQRVLFDAFGAEAHITPALEPIMDRLTQGDTSAWGEAASIFAALDEHDTAARIMQASDEQRDRAWRLLTARTLLGRRASYRPEHLEELRRVIAATPEALREEETERLAGDAAEDREFAHLRDALRRGQSIRPLREVMEDAPQVTAALRKHLRLAAPVEGGVEARITVAPGAFADVVRAQARIPGVTPQVEVVACPHPRRRNEKVLLGYVTTEAIIDGRPVRQQVQAMLGTTTSERPDFHVKRAVKEWGDLGFVHRTEQRSRVGYNLELNGSGQLLGEGDDTRSWPTFTAEEFLGVERCMHARASTARNRGDDALVISCPDCQRQRLAVVPYHRLPEAQRRKFIQDEDAYLKRERGYALLAGTPEPPATLGRLAAQDGEMPAQPAAYAIGVEPARRGARSQSLRAQLAGR